MFGDLSLSHILILLLVLVLVFGARRIPEIFAARERGRVSPRAPRHPA